MAEGARKVESAEGWMLGGELRAAARTAPVTGREDPSERAQDGFLAPTTRIARARHRTRGLGKATDPAAEEIERGSTQPETLHVLILNVQPL